MSKAKKLEREAAALVTQSFDVADKRGLVDFAVVLTDGGVSHLVWSKPKVQMIASIVRLMQDGAEAEGLIAIHNQIPICTVLESVPEKRAGQLLWSFIRALDNRLDRKPRRIEWDNAPFLGMAQLRKPLRPC